MVLSPREKAFARHFAEITENPEYQKLKKIPRHGATNTFNHSVRVGYAAWKLARRMGVDPESAAKVGLLHDFCLVNYRDGGHTFNDRRLYCFYHPEDAVENSLKYFPLSAKEQKAIRSHMFPLAKYVPDSRLALVLNLADKEVSTREAAMSSIRQVGRVRARLARQ